MFGGIGKTFLGVVGILFYKCESRKQEVCQVCLFHTTEVTIEFLYLIRIERVCILQNVFSDV